MGKKEKNIGQKIAQIAVEVLKKNAWGKSKEFCEQIKYLAPSLSKKIIPSDVYFPKQIKKKLSICYTMLEQLQLGQPLNFLGYNLF